MSFPSSIRRSPRRMFSAAFLVVLLLVCVLGAVENLAVSAVPVLERELGISVPEAALLTAMWGVAASLSMPLVGKLGDLFGAKRTLLVAVAVAAAGAIVCSVAASFPLALIGFALLGLGASGTVTAVVLVQELCAEEYRPSATGYVVGAIVLGGVAGTILAGPTVDAFSRFAMYVTPAAVLALCALLAVFLVPNRAPSKPDNSRFDWIGLLAFCTALVALQLALLSSSTTGWASIQVLTGLGVAIVAAVAFVLIERRALRPFIDLAMLARPSMRGSVLVGFLAGFGYGAGFFLLQQLLVLPIGPNSPGFGYSLTQISLTLAPCLIVGIAFGPIGGALVRTLGLRTTVVIALSITTIGLGMLIWWHSEAWQIVLGSVLVIGVGGAMLFTTALSGVQAAVEGAESGIATSIVMTARNLGFIGGAPIVAVFILVGSPASAPAPTELGVQLAFTVAALIALCGFTVVRKLSVNRASAQKTGSVLPEQAPEAGGADEAAAPGPGQGRSSQD
ncbi:MFS transporter [Streptosporangium sp. NPDC006013]|uniref:MFS transporter n=1 Tax=Streptosporangium sp. NPDC006013 TaxID=3155596 RepID=UPI0033B4FD77